ncbi:MAG: glucose-6-phosphate isomerase [Gemmatimonadetes bacterium]|nr:glucose-6-phosphate isomerase [Gemmatimonadota bacterium]
MSERLSLDCNNMLAPIVGAHGIDPARLDAMAEQFREIHEEVEQRRATGRLGFYALPYDRELVSRILAFAEGVGQASDTVVVLGIGGSALGTVALQRALLKPRWNELDDEAREWFPRLYVLDNIDPATFGPMLDRLDPGRTLFIVISKSGTTAETMAQFLIVKERMMSALGEDYRRHFLFTTDPEGGVLRRIAGQESIPAFPVPPDVGGRFSVLSAVGLLPAALTGIDITALLEGAAAMDARCRTGDLHANPAALFAALQFLADTERGAPIHVVVPYGDLLHGMGDWFRQLWGESLGKRHDLDGREVFRGPTPVNALGVTDQHSQLQLWMEGPFDKTVTFLAAREHAHDLTIPKLHTDIDALACLGGHTLGGLLDAERRGTASALTRSGRMNMTIEIPAVTAHAVGELFMLFQIATVYAGAFYRVEPLDQPGVELGKQIAYALLGRPGFEPPSDPPPRPRWISR